MNVSLQVGTRLPTAVSCPQGTVPEVCGKPRVACPRICFWMATTSAGGQAGPLVRVDRGPDRRDRTVDDAAFVDFYFLLDLSEQHLRRRQPFSVS